MWPGTVQQDGIMPAVLLNQIFLPHAAGVSQGIHPTANMCQPRNHAHLAVSSQTAFCDAACCPACCSRRALRSASTSLSRSFVGVSSLVSASLSSGSGTLKRSLSPGCAFLLPAQPTSKISQ